MPYNFQPGHDYRRRDVYRIIGIDEDTHGSNWDTGCARHGDDWFIFCNIGVPGRTGHDYANQWVGANLHWHHKNNSHLRQPSVKSMLSPIGENYVFYRTDNQGVFTFAGRGQVVSFDDTSPVKVIWSFPNSSADSDNQ